MPETHTATPAWHALTAEESFTRLASRADGLTADEARERLAHYGPNLLPPPPRRSAAARFFSQFNNVLIYVLLASAATTALLGHWADTSVIIGVVVINALIGFIQEGKAERAVEAIRGLLSLRATVLGGGRSALVEAEALVPGDLVLLESGDRVPADLRLVRVRNLRADESALTGESLPVEKAIAPVDAAAPVADRTALAFSGTLITYGQASGVVVATGAATEIGRISGLLSQVHALETPLLGRIALFGRALSLWIGVLAAVTFAMGVWVRDYPLHEMFLATVGLAVAAIPEGLPAVITITLAIGVQRMARRNAIVRRLPAVETLGSVTVICTDKTGTLTRNEMTVQSVVTARGVIEVSGSGYDPRGGFTFDQAEITPEAEPTLIELTRAAVLCSEGSVELRDGRWQPLGDPTEAALMVLAAKSGLREDLIRAQYPRTDVIPFESEHRFMATLHHDHADHRFILLKGAPERVLEMCSRERVSGEDRPLRPAYWHAAIDALAQRGQRLIALAFRTEVEARRDLRFSDVEGGLTLLGIAGIVDPPRPEAIAAIAECHRAGIAVKMITGDHAVTARAIAAQMGIGNGNVTTGAQLEPLGDQALRQVVGETDLFARASPEHKLRLVEALQANGEVVAMTGDGVNDAPALRRADMGVAMGVNGTEAAKEAAQMVLADDNFATIVHAVEEGRTVYDNVRKSILFILPTNGGEALTVTAAVLLGVAMPLTPLQILWVNMVAAVTLALALAFEPTEQGAMRRPPRDPGAPLLPGELVWRIGFVSLILVAGTLGLFLWEQDQGRSVDHARTIAVNALVLFDVFFLVATRTIDEPTFSARGFTGNPYVPLTIVLVLALQLLFTYAPPLQALFKTVALAPGDWMRATVVAASVLFAVEVEKWRLRRARSRTAARPHAPHHQRDHNDQNE